MGNRTTRLGMDNSDFMLKNLNKDCHPLQYIRELTKNSIEAIERKIKEYYLKGQLYEGKILWCIDPDALKNDGVRKLCIIDNGDGMTGPDMVKYLNNLASGYNPQDFSGNYGIGAKISTLPQNPEGVLYFSWIEGQQGSMIHSWWDDEAKAFGLKQQETTSPEGLTEYEDFRLIPDTFKPFIIDKSGTKVVLLGKTANEDTTLPPEIIRDKTGKFRLVPRYLNTRFYKIPSNITIQAETSDGKKETVRGMSSFLDRYSIADGKLELTSYPATAHWWILVDSKNPPVKKGPDGQEYKNPRHKENDFMTCAHVATLYQNELYDIYAGHEGISKIQDFGVIQGASNIVIYIEPHSTGRQDVTTDVARTILKINQQPLPWSEWQQEFDSKMPQEIKDYMNRQSSGKSRTSVQEKLKETRELYKLKFYKKSSNGKTDINPSLDLEKDGGPYRVKRTEKGQSTKVSESETGTHRNNNNTPPEPTPQPTPPSPSPENSPEYVLGSDRKMRGTTTNRKFSPGDTYAQLANESGTAKGRATGESPYPQIHWHVSKPVLDGDVIRGEGELENKFGRYIENKHLIILNGDFPGVQDDIIRWTDEVKVKQPNLDPGLIEKEVTTTVRVWYEILAAETVMGILGLRNIPNCHEWTHTTVKNLLSNGRGEETLTAVAVQRYHTTACIKRELGSKRLLSE